MTAITKLNSAVAPQAPVETPSDVKPADPSPISLDQLCRELKLNPREARMSLRLAAKQKGQYPNLGKDHVARQPWQWTPGSKALQEARKALTSSPAP